MLEQQLGHGDYFVGGAFSIADICLFAYVHRASEGGFDMQPYPAISAWCRRIEARPAFSRLDQLPDGELSAQGSTSLRAIARRGKR